MEFVNNVDVKSIKKEEIRHLIHAIHDIISVFVEIHFIGHPILFEWRGWRGKLPLIGLQK